MRLEGDKRVGGGLFQECISKGGWGGVIISEINQVQIRPLIATKGKAEGSRGGCLCPSLFCLKEVQAGRRRLGLGDREREGHSAAPLISLHIVDRAPTTGHHYYVNKNRFEVPPSLSRSFLRVVVVVVVSCGGHAPGPGPGCGRPCAPASPVRHRHPPTTHVAVIGNCACVYVYVQVVVVVLVEDDRCATPPTLSAGKSKDLHEETISSFIEFGIPEIGEFSIAHPTPIHLVLTLELMFKLFQVPKTRYRSEIGGIWLQVIDILFFLIDLYIPQVFISIILVSLSI